MIDIEPYRQLLIGLVAWTQIGALATWSAMLGVHGPRWLAFQRGSNDPADWRWASVCEMAAVQVMFSLQWRIWPAAIDARPTIALLFWAALYALSAASSVRISLAYGNPHNARLAMMLHAACFAVAIFAAIALH